MNDKIKANIMKDNDVKIIAFHLPQYHTFPENDSWWGEGFTEWVNVKKAEPLFPGHNQPRIPYDDDYYNMLDIRTLEKQAEVSSSYGIYGFCYYHYWFNGKLLMEQPLELLLNHEEINQKYCLCWANEPWTRNWDGNSGVILIGQEYGGVREWEEHFKYLLKFFKDSRYIKYDNKPVLVIYRTESIPSRDEMFDYYNKRAVEEGFDGLFLLEEMNAYQSKKMSEYTDGIIEFEPSYTLARGRDFFMKSFHRVISEMKNFGSQNHISHYNYKSIWNIIKKNVMRNDVYPCGFVDWDNTARQGNRGVVFSNWSLDEFSKGMTSLIRYSKEKGYPFVFINAWNEWAEGCYLEPDTKHGFMCLEVIKKIVEETKL